MGMLGNLLRSLFLDGKAPHKIGGQSAETMLVVGDKLMAADTSAHINDEGVRWYAEGRLQEAAEAFQRAVALDDTNADALANLGIVLSLAGKQGKALKLFERSLEVRPKHPGTLSNYAFALRNVERLEDAIRALTDAVAMDARSEERWCDLGLMYREFGDLKNAQRCCTEALAINGGYGRAIALAAAIAMDEGRFNLTEKYLERPEAHEDPSGLARGFQAFLQLGQFRFEKGWDDYQARKQFRGESPERPYPFPAWNGEELRGKAIAVYAEQGLGDEIMFASCIPDVANKAGSVLLECDPRLAAVFGRSFGPNVQVRPLQRKGQKILPSSDLGPIDFQVPAGDLPRYLRRSWNDFPGRPYLSVSRQRVGEWGSFLSDHGSGLKVGLAWRGGLGRTRSKVRSLAVSELAPLLAIPGTNWFALQFRLTAEERAHLNGQVGMAPEIPSFDDLDYDDLAAFVSALDLVITVCCSTVHFAGALGTPTWALVPAVPEWRYGFAGAAMPWYRSVRLFRQRQIGVWDQLIFQLAEELTKLVTESDEKRHK